MKDFKDKVAVITGGAGGIGQAIAERCAREGMKVVLADLEEAALAGAERDFKAAGAQVLAVRTDVSKPGDVEALAARTLEAFGAVHLLFNNAGVGAGTTVWESTLADWEWVLGVNLWGVVHGLRTFVPIMLNQAGPGHIVNTASIAGLISGPGLGVYKVSKHAVVSLSETLCCELKERGSQIGVSVLCPMWVKTGIAHSDRNRPAELRNLPLDEPVRPEVAAAEEALRRVVANGIPPEEVAGQVFDAVQKERFYILTHPETRRWVQNRMTNILEDRNPA